MSCNIFYEMVIQKSYDTVTNYHGEEKAKYYFFKIRIRTPKLACIVLINDKNNTCGGISDKMKNEHKRIKYHT